MDWSSLAQVHRMGACSNLSRTVPSDSRRTLDPRCAARSFLCSYTGLSEHLISPEKEMPQQFRLTWTSVSQSPGIAELVFIAKWNLSLRGKWVFRFCFPFGVAWIIVSNIHLPGGCISRELQPKHYDQSPSVHTEINVGSLGACLWLGPLCQWTLGELAFPVAICLTWIDIGQETTENSWGLVIL